MLQNIVFHIWFKVARPIKRKYNLSTNCVLVLNCAYLLYMYKDRLFTLRALRDTASYYNADKISSYIKVLVDNSFIIPSGIVKNRQMYSISEKGIEVIQELNESYSKELSLFCTQYNIIL